MLRVPCKVCGGQILPATVERNDGLCGQCAKGNRPCIYCGGRVDKPLSDGTYAHLYCFKRKESGEVSLGWKTAEDIDWPMVERKIHEKLSALFANPPNPCPP